MRQYEIVTVVDGQVVERAGFESEHADLDVDPHNYEDMPIGLGSNQYVISLDN